MREPVVPQLTADQFLLWEAGRRERFELQHGYVLAFAGGTLDHDQIAFNVRTALRDRFAPPCRTFGSDVKVRVSPGTVYYADAGVVCEEMAGDAVAISAPRVVVEVLSPSTRAFDQVEKRAAYRSLPSLMFILLVHTGLRRVEIDRRDAAGAWDTETIDYGDFVIGNGAISLDRIYAESDLAAEA